MDRSNSSQQRRGALLAAVACVLVGGSFTANSVLGDFPHAGGQALRYAVACLLLVPLTGRGGLAPLRALTARQWVRLALLAGVGMVGFNMAVLAAERTSEPAVPGVFVGCAPVVVAVIAPALDGRRPTRAVCCGALFVAMGAFTVQGWGRADASGIAWSVAALCGEVGFAVLAVPVLRTIGPVLLSAAACGLGAVEALGLALLVDGGGWLRMPDSGEAVALLWQALIVTVIGFVCWYRGLQRIGPERATLFSGLIPVAAAATAPIVGVGGYGPAQAAGSLLVGAGVAVGAGVLGRRWRDAAPSSGTPEVAMTEPPAGTAASGPAAPGRASASAGVAGPDSLPVRPTAAPADAATACSSGGGAGAGAGAERFGAATACGAGRGPGGVEDDAGDQRGVVVHRHMAATRQADEPGPGDDALGADSLPG
ncbi:drug/metabolite transporter (DMT)-like permease [Streptomyces zagrosensis]|uniref:Drug/metabolite transporter (DMT)-like permease n=1 Tax=Streptomyces zagrosensis TaxID=1042984 RepID=A0A7W9QBD0_9ACTN|nr:drug/metabolite transporter (DMT)-like permease [Streptomyces zagrosensis]